MRKVLFTIDDLAWFEKKMNLSKELSMEILGEMKPFKAIFTLYGNGKNIDRYELTDFDGNEININDLNGYEKGVLINDCYAYFEGREYCNKGTEPCGVVDIMDMEKLIEHTYGTYIYMKLSINRKEYEIDCFIRENGDTYRTTVDGTPEREMVIKAFNELY